MVWIGGGDGEGGVASVRTKFSLRLNKNSKPLVSSDSDYSL